MTDLACFCGCFYSFEGGARTCPKCGQVAAVTARPAFNGSGHSLQEQPIAAMNGAGQNGQTAGTWREWAEANPGALDIAITPGSGLANESVLLRAGRR